MPPLVLINHTLAFLLEIALLVLLGTWGFGLVEGPWLNWLAVGLALAVAIGLWGRFAAPKSTKRLPMPGLLWFKIAMFGAGTAAAWGMGEPTWALIFGGVSALHLTLAATLDVV